MKSKRLRISYSLLLLWSQGRTDDAIALYQHKEMEKTQPLIDGIAFHKAWADLITKEKRLKLGGTSFTFVDPICEEKHFIEYNDRWDLSGMFDCVDNKTLYEWKSGVASSMEYANSFQVGMYFLISKLKKIKIDRAIILHYNQYEDRADVSIVWNNKAQIDKVKNIIDSLAPEIEEHFIKIGILEGE